jgi:hypothetical protein
LTQLGTLGRQPDRHDINCQPLTYWIAKFREEGFSVDEAANAAVKGEWTKIVRMPWYGQNVLVFRAAR